MVFVTMFIHSGIDAAISAISNEESPETCSGPILKYGLVYFKIGPLQV